MLTTITNLLLVQLKLGHTCRRVMYARQPDGEGVLHRTLRIFAHLLWRPLRNWHKVLGGIEKHAGRCTGCIADDLATGNGRGKVSTEVLARKLECTWRKPERVHVHAVERYGE